MKLVYAALISAAALAVSTGSSFALVHDLGGPTKMKNGMCWQSTSSNDNGGIVKACPKPMKAMHKKKMKKAAAAKPAKK
jgi:hypothetical protein